MAVRNPEKRLVEAAMELAADRPWDEVGYREIAAKAGVPLAEAWAAAPGRQAILGHLSRMADQAVLKEPAALEDGDARDRVFDVLMRRFDALRPYRAGLASVVQSFGRNPGGALCGGAGLFQSMRAMLLAAALPIEGGRGAVRVKIVTLVWLATLRTFLRDESEDLSPTMATLDSQLRRAERFAGWLSRATGPRRRDRDADEGPLPAEEPA
ncbi:MAG: TetR/AcrR family transcriptional regulator [Pseudomonadota bacterium]